MLCRATYGCEKIARRRMRRTVGFCAIGAAYAAGSLEEAAPITVYGFF